jgi:hypothetical protein
MRFDRDMRQTVVNQTLAFALMTMGKAELTGKIKSVSEIGDYDHTFAAITYLTLGVGLSIACVSVLLDRFEKKLVGDIVSSIRLD